MGEWRNLTQIYERFYSKVYFNPPGKTRLIGLEKAETMEAKRLSGGLLVPIPVRNTNFLWGKRTLYIIDVRIRIIATYGERFSITGSFRAGET